MLRGASVKSTCSRMVWDFSCEVSSRHGNAHIHSQRIAERKNTPPVQTDSENIETVWKKARFERPAMRGLAAAEFVTVLPVDSRQSRGHEQPRPRLRHLASDAARAIAARISALFLALGGRAI